ncbi:hypothetical protein ANCCAN_15615 [Ancylostoma caninum]|uniref:Uncharacterized protein n=1 Tax=Ancylostoma caninum TaxID=29170 RepID=A0A368G461_ANCCA|nr:hypothetical protein ANCCAN_15615 [Ancylostoma caninum]
MDFLDFQEGEDLPEPAPAYLHLTFSSSSVVTVYFDPSVSSRIQGHNRGCEVFICHLAAFYGDCIKERVKQHMPFISFDELRFDGTFELKLFENLNRAICEISLSRNGIIPRSEKGKL